MSARRPKPGAGICLIMLMASPGVAFPASAQQQQPSQGRAARSPVGEVGQRQTRQRPETGIAPMARIENRLDTRVPLRIRNRIDRDYDPQADPAARYRAATERARAATRPVRR